MYTSFQRQLHLYGFKKITKGIDKDSYYHELFLRDRPDLSCLMIRTKTKSHGSNDDTVCDIFSSPILNSRIPEASFYSIRPDSSSGEVKSTQLAAVVPVAGRTLLETCMKEVQNLANSSCHMSKPHRSNVHQESEKDEESSESCRTYFDDIDDSELFNNIEFTDEKIDPLQHSDDSIWEFFPTDADFERAVSLFCPEEFNCSLHNPIRVTCNDSVQKIDTANFLPCPNELSVGSASPRSVTSPFVLESKCCHNEQNIYGCKRKFPFCHEQQHLQKPTKNLILAPFLNPLRKPPALVSSLL